MNMAQVSVKTRARAALAMEEVTAATSTAPTSKRRKINDTNEEQKKSSSNGTKSGATVVSPVTEEGCSSPTSDEELQASCCSSNGSVDEEKMKLLDLEVESAQVETSTYNCGEQTERRTMSLGENSQEAETNSHRSYSTVQIMPTELELEEFFTIAEKDIQKRFQDKYNYDIVKDVPLEGRYEWFQRKP